MWRSLKTISGFKAPYAQAVGDLRWVNNLYLHFLIFDQSPSPPPTQDLASLPQLFTPLTQSNPTPLYSLKHPFTPPVTVPLPTLVLWKRCGTSAQNPHARDLNSFRPVALMSRLMKTLERLVPWGISTPCWYQVGGGGHLLYLLHHTLSHLEKPGSIVRILLFDFSSAFNTIQPVLLRDKLEMVGVGSDLAEWILDYLTNQPQFVRAQDCVSHLCICSIGSSPGERSGPLSLHPLHCRLQTQQGRLCPAEVL